MVHFVRDFRHQTPGLRAKKRKMIRQDNPDAGIVESIIVVREYVTRFEHRDVR